MRPFDFFTLFLGCLFKALASNGLAAAPHVSSKPNALVPCFSAQRTLSSAFAEPTARDPTTPVGLLNSQ